MGKITNITLAFFISLIFVGISIFFFLEGENFRGRLFIFLAIYVFVSLFFVFKSLYYLKHKATFNEIMYVVILPIIPVLLLVAQQTFELNSYSIISQGSFSTEQVDYTFFINMVDFLLLPYYLFSDYLLFRTFIRYPFIRFKGTSEGGIPPKLVGFLLTILIPTLYFLTSFLYFNNLMLVIAGIIYLYSGVMSLFI